MRALDTADIADAAAMVVMIVDAPVAPGVKHAAAAVFGRLWDADPDEYDAVIRRARTLAAERTLPYVAPPF